MAIPSSRNSGRAGLLNVNLDNFVKRYSSITELLSHEANPKSQSIKRVTVKWPDEVYELYVQGDVILAVIAQKANFSLEDRAFWCSPDELSQEDRDALSKIKVDHDILYYQNFRAALELQREFLLKAFSNVAFDTAVQLDLELKKRGLEAAVVNALLSKKEASFVHNWDYVLLRASTLASLAESDGFKQLRALRAMGLEGVSPDTVILTFTDQSFIPFTDEERLLVEAGRNSASLLNVQQLSGGFRWHEVLETLERLSTEGAISISGAVAAEAIVLPTLDEAIEIEEAQALEAAKDRESAESAEDSGSAAFLVDDVDPTVLFDEAKANQDQEVAKSAEHRFTSTKGLDVNLLAALSQRLPEVSDELRVQVDALLAQNLNLENEVKAIELELEPPSKEYAEKVSVYDDMVFGKELDAIESDSEDEIKTLAFDDSNISDHRALSNELFFIIEALERRRQTANDERFEVLKNISALLAISQDSEGGKALQAKIAGINGVQNIAFFKPKEAELNEAREQAEQFFTHDVGRKKRRLFGR